MFNAPYAGNENADYKFLLKQELQKPPSNNRCSDCHNLDPTWCSTTFNVFLCTRCATLHRKLLNKDPCVSNIKSIVLDHWTNEQVFNFISHEGNNKVRTDMFTSSDNAYDLEELIKDKYLKPMTREANERMATKFNNNKRFPILSGRIAKDYELTKYASHIRQIQDKSSTFYNVDSICEALSLTHGNVFDAVEILRYNDKSRNRNEDNYDDNDLPPPSLPKRPDTSQGPKPAVFLGTDSSHLYPQSTTSSLIQTRPAVFDGSVDLSTSQLAPANASNVSINQPQQTSMLTPTQPPHQDGLYLQVQQMPSQQVTPQQTTPQWTVQTVMPQHGMGYLVTQPLATPQQQQYIPAQSTQVSMEQQMPVQPTQTSLQQAQVPLQPTQSSMQQQLPTFQQVPQQFMGQVPQQMPTQPPQYVANQQQYQPQQPQYQQPGAQWYQPNQHQQ